MSIEVLSKEFELLKQDIAFAYNAKGMKASGKFEQSLETLVTETETGYIAKLIGEDYAQQLETGRQGGTYPPIEKIKQWILDKGVFSSVLQEIKISSLAFLIARKIYRQGWNRQGYGGVELISEVVTPERIQKIIDEVGVVESFRITTEIIGFINELDMVA